jgi:tetratricopeptide (TPR) repeat protein
LNNKGDILFDVGNYSGAIHHYDKVLSIDPNDKYALLSKAISLFGLGNYTDALKTYDKAFVPVAVYTYILKSKGDTLFEKGDFTTAIETYDQALSINSSDIYTLHSKGKALSYLGKHDEASKNFDKALSLNTTDKFSSTGNIQNETQKRNQNLLTYRDDIFGIKFDYPDTWGYKEIRYFFITVKGIQLFPIAEISLDEFKFNENKIGSNELIDTPVGFGIQRDDGTPFKNMPLDQYKDFEIERLEANGWNINSVYRTTIGNNVEAYQVNYDGSIENGMNILFVKPPDAFQIYFISYDYLSDKYLPAVEKMINSIEFLK